MMISEARRQEKRLNHWVWILSTIVFLLVLMMRRYKIETDFDFSFLPAMYSSLNVLTTLLLIVGFYQMRINKKTENHRKVMSLAIVTSALFLIGYVVYHFTTAETSFCRQGLIRTVYFVVLVTHVVLAALILPFILFTYTRAITSQFERHKSLAKRVFPIWLYVSISGPIVFLLLRPCYQ